MWEGERLVWLVKYPSCWGDLLLLSYGLAPFEFSGSCANVLLLLYGLDLTPRTKISDYEWHSKSELIGAHVKAASAFLILHLFGAQTGWMACLVALMTSGPFQICAMPTITMPPIFLNRDIGCPCHRMVMCMPVPYMYIRLELIFPRNILFQHGQILEKKININSPHHHYQSMPINIYFSMYVEFAHCSENFSALLSERFP